MAFTKEEEVLILKALGTIANKLGTTDLTFCMRIGKAIQKRGGWTQSKSSTHKKK